VKGRVWYGMEEREVKLGPMSSDPISFLFSLRSLITLRPIKGGMVSDSRGIQREGRYVVCGWRLCMCVCSEEAE